MESILTSIKEMLGNTEDYTAFDTEIIAHINDVFMTLWQLGIGTENVFSISSDKETWKDFLGESLPMYQAVKTYIYKKVKLAFDPPQSSAHADALKRQADESEWRLVLQYELIKAKEGSA